MDTCMEMDNWQSGEPTPRSQPSLMADPCVHDSSIAHPFYSLHFTYFRFLTDTATIPQEVHGELLEYKAL